jgi:5-methylcytosine-specific restriction endonuclease McrA
MSRRKFTPLEREFICERAGRRCEYCKFPFDYSHDAFHIEHIVPLLQGGSDELINLAFACDSCNTIKWTYTQGTDPQTGEVVPLFNPRTGTWNTHFSWSEDFAFMIGKTNVGRATIEVLKLNRTGLVNIRKALNAYGVHP